MIEHNGKLIFDYKERKDLEARKAKFRMGHFTLADEGDPNHDPNELLEFFDLCIENFRKQRERCWNGNRITG